MSRASKCSSGMSREGDYCKCSKRRPVVCPVVCREKATTASVLRGGQWYVARRRLLQVFQWYVARR